MLTSILIQLRIIRAVDICSWNIEIFLAKTHALPLSGCEVDQELRLFGYTKCLANSTNINSGSRIEVAWQEIIPLGTIRFT
jgi:hypothetical protein